jgi:hypothetical protein
MRAEFEAAGNKNLVRKESNMLTCGSASWMQWQVRQNLSTEQAGFTKFLMFHQNIFKHHMLFLRVQ